MTPDYLATSHATACLDIALMRVGRLVHGEFHYEYTSNAPQPAVCIRSSTVNRTAPPLSFCGDVRMRELVRPPLLGYDDMARLATGQVIVVGTMTTDVPVVWTYGGYRSLCSPRAELLVGAKYLTCEMRPGGFEWVVVGC